MAKQVTRYFIILFKKSYKEAITMNTNIYPRTNDLQTVYLNAVINNPHIKVGDYTIYNDFANDPIQFEKNNVLYHYPVTGDRLIIGKFCSIACGALLRERANGDKSGNISGSDLTLDFILAERSRELI